MTEALACFSMTSISCRLESEAPSRALRSAYSCSCSEIFYRSFFSASGSSLVTYLTASLGDGCPTFAGGVFCVTSAVCLEALFSAIRFLLEDLWFASYFFELLFASDLDYFDFGLDFLAAFFSGGAAALRSVFSTMDDSDC